MGVGTGVAAGVDDPFFTVIVRVSTSVWLPPASRT